MDASLEAQVQSLVSCVMKLVTLCNSLLDQRLNPKNGIEAFESNLSLAMARKSLGENQKTIESLMNENDTLAKQFEELRAEKERVTQGYRRLSESYDRIAKEHAELINKRADLYSLQAQNEVLQKEVQEIRVRCTEIVQERDDAQASLRATSQAWSAAEARIASLSNELAQLQAKNTRLESELQDSVNSRSRLIELSEGMTQQISERERIIAALRKEIQELEQDAVSAIEEASIPPLIRGLDEALLEPHGPNQETTA